MKNAGIYVLTVCAVALAMLGSSCKKETKPFEVGEIIEIGASIDNDDNGAKTFILENENSTDVCWSDDDKLTLFQMGGSESSEFSIVEGAGSRNAKFRGECPGDGPFLAFYPNNNVTYASAKFTYTLPSIIEYDAMSNHNGPMVGYLAEIAEDKVLQFHNVLPCIYLKLKGTAKVKKVTISDKRDNTISSGTLTFSVYNSGANLGAINTTTIRVKANQSDPNASKYVSVVSQNAIQLSETEPTVFSFSVPIGVGGRGSNLAIYVYDENDNIIQNYSASLGFSGAQIGHAYRLTIENVDPAQPLPEYSGHFSVASGKKVDFAPGNLYCDASGKFHIEESQCSLQEYYDPSHVNLFFFATSQHIENSCQEYWSDSWYSYAGVNDIFFTNETADTPNPDFEVDGSTNTGYRILSNAEWKYLLGDGDGRINAADLRAVKRISVPGYDMPVAGLVVLADGSEPEWLSRIHTLADVNRVGALFLSSQGAREGWGGINSVGNYSFYWGSECYDKYGSSYRAYAMQAYWNTSNNTTYIAIDGVFYDSGHAVRLAKDVTAK